MIIPPPHMETFGISAQEDHTIFAQRRAAIDAVVTTRARVIRCGLFGTYLFRPNPLREDTDEMKARWLDEMQSNCNGVSRALALVQGTDPEGEILPEITAWLAQCAAAFPEEVETLRKNERLTIELIDAAPKGGRAFEALLIDHAVAGRTSLFPAISRLCEGFWANLDAQRHAEVDRARTSNETIQKTLHRLERIGTHVRLVSLNASVEAARVGENGKGLGVIAQEFKSLAEEIQHLAQSARDTLVELGNVQE